MAQPMTLEQGRGEGVAVPAPRESRWQWVRQTLEHAGPGQVIFSLNNACNAGCGFCSFALDVLPRADWRFVDTVGACRALDVLSGLFVRYLIVSGGEPTLHPELDAIVRHARQRHMSVLLVSNGSRLTSTRCEQLVEAGVSSVVISIDAATTQHHEDNRRLPGVTERIRRANERLRALGVQSTASVTISRLLDDYEALGVFLRDLGFGAVTFSYPLTNLPSSFLGYRPSALVDFSPAELDEIFAGILRLKRSFPVVNPSAALEEMRRFVRGEPQRFECLGGYRYFYLDWNLDVWRCHNWDQPIGSVFDLDESKYVRDGCTKCMVDCYRDASVMQHIAVTAADAARELRQGHPLRALSRLLRRENLESVQAVLECQQWITSL